MLSSINITLQSPAELLITDSRGRRTGFNPITQTTYNEIPHSLYYTERLDNAETGELGMPIKSLHIGQPEDGFYRLQVIGHESGTFNLSIGAFDLNGSSTIQELKTGLTQNKSVSEYLITYTSQPGQPTTIEKIVVIK
jgi:hypothetical protein